MESNDLLAIIFAYAELSQRAKYSNISKNTIKITTSYTYIISLGRGDIKGLFEYSYRNNKVELLKFCLKNPLVNPAGDDNYAIRLASVGGHLEVVRLLLTDNRVNPADVNNLAIQSASHQGHLAVVRLLLANKRVNPADWSNRAIRLASTYEHLEVVRLLLAESRVYHSLDLKTREKYQRQIQ